MYKNTIIYTIGNMLPKVIVFLMLPIYMNYLEPEEYGLIQTVNALVSVLAILYLTSLRTSVTRSYIDYDNHNDKQGFILSISIFLITFSLVLSGVLFNLKDLLSSILFNNIPTDPYYMYLIILSFLSVFSTIPLTLLRIREQAIKYVSFNLIETMLIITLTIYLLIIKDMGAQGSLLALIYAKLIMAILYIFYIISFTKLKFQMCKPSYVYSSLALAIPLIPHHLAGWANSAADRVLIEQILSLRELGIYSLGAQFNAGLMTLITSFNLAYAPRFYKMMKDIKVTQSFFSRMFNNVVSITTIFIFIGILLVPIFVQYFGNESYDSNYLFVGLLFGGTLWHLGYIMSVTSIIYYKKMNWVAIVTVSTAILNIILNILLIPLWGIVGASVVLYFVYFLEFYFVKSVANKFTKNIFQVKVKTIYAYQSLLLINLLIAWIFESYLFILISIIIISGFFIFNSNLAKKYYKKKRR